MEVVSTFKEPRASARAELCYMVMLLFLICCWWATQSSSLADDQSTTQPLPNLPYVIDYTLNPAVDPTEIHNGPQRIVCIAPSASELCAALGLAERVVGRTQYCIHPPAIQSAVVVGAYSDTNYEKIIALQPDLILITARSPKLAENLTRLNLPFETLPDNTIEEIYSAIDKLGRLCNRPHTAQTLRENLQRDLQSLSAAAGDHRTTKVLFTIDPLPLQPQSLYAGGPGSHLDDLLHLAGYTNALEGLTTQQWPRVALETLVLANPDFILEARPPEQPVDSEQLYQSWASLQQLPVFARQRVRTLSTTAAVTPGPRLNLALRDIITALQTAPPTT